MFPQNNYHIEIKCLSYWWPSLLTHDDVIKWKHFPCYGPFMRGIHRSSVNFSDAEFDVFFYLRLNKRLSKQSWVWWIETPALQLWRHCNMYASVTRPGWFEHVKENNTNNVQYIPLSFMGILCMISHSFKFYIYTLPCGAIIQDESGIGFPLSCL